jgi:N-acetylmuramoyl-L-alanine amidase
MDRGLIKSQFYVINHTTCPAVLIEVGFISNADERNRLLDKKRQEEGAKAISDGIVNYFKDRGKKK